MIVDEKQLVDVPTSACVFKNYLCVVVGPDICFFSVTKENTLCWQNKFQPDSNLQVRQTIVSCSVVSNLLAVGNDEGRIRIYSLDSTWTDCRPPQTVLVHQKSVADIHFSQDGSLLVSVSLDRSCCVWNSRTGAKIITLDSPPVRRYGIKAHFRCCQFSCVSVVEPGLLYTVDVSLDSGSFISGWRMDTWQPLFCRKVSRDPVTFMSTCSVSGLEYIAVGTNEGDVMIWIHNPYQVQGLLRDASEPKRTSSLVIIEKDNISTQGWLSLINTTQVSNLSLYRFYRKHPLQFLPVTGLSWSTSHQKNSKSSIATLLVTCADGYLRIFEIFPQRNDSMTNVYWLLLPFCVFLLALFYSLLWSL
ncbi:uncharacterized protein Gasu_54750 [Galdieria sulphuraria]|uniref:Uncharacterized protein n=1 Tax=Galdieria sulphuraria TaxID=130081 RepID=M2XTD7_GALSU|nr:uncharacterized protein Gasu_54750 [Galdieria sulphuraria]EME26903.1 hypothetical protein Gasu_54750 [Galdieria sulphuraria]|eukprot:XP_005703423.1 hypothetical protein Gasu_54750 [Galdieria sulphuraria]